MFSFFILFSILGALVDAAPLPMPAFKQSHEIASRFYSHDLNAYNGIPCWQDGRQGFLDDAVCVFAALSIGSSFQDHQPFVDGTQCWRDGHIGEIQDALCVVADVDTARRQIYPDPSFIDGERCWLNGHQGFWQDDVCILANLDVGLKRSFDTVPSYIDGTSCLRGGRQGVWRDATCILTKVDIGLRKRYFGSGPALLDSTPCWRDGHNGFWRNELCVLADLDVAIERRRLWSQSELIDGDSCWRDGHAGIARNAVCVLADLNIDAKRDLLDKPFFHPGNPCWKNGRQGNLDNEVCVLADIQVDKRQLIGQSNRNGKECWDHGLVGTFRDALCVVADVELNKRLLGNGASGDVLGNLLEPVGGQYDSVYPYSSSPVDTADLDAVISVAETGRTYKRNGIFQNSQDGNEVDGAVKNVFQFVDHVKERDLLGLGQTDLTNDNVVANVEAAVGVNREYGDRQVFGDILPGRGVGFVKRNLGGLGGVNGLGLGQPNSGLDGTVDNLMGGSGTLGL